MGRFDPEVSKPVSREVQDDGLGICRRLDGLLLADPLVSG